MASNLACKLCMNVPKKNAITKINALPKTFTFILEEMSGVKFSQAEALNMIICKKCLEFLKNMENSSSRPKSNKISAAGKERVYKLMARKHIPTAEAIEIVIAEERAKELLIESGLKTVDSEGNLLPKTRPILVPEVPIIKPRLSGAQRKKAGILMDAGMAPADARQLIYAATMAKYAARQLEANQMANMQGPNQQWPIGQRRQNKKNVQGPLPQGRQGNNLPKGAGQGNNLPKGGAAQTGKSKTIQKAPVQRVAPVKAVLNKAGPAPKGSNQKGPANKKPTPSTDGILAPQNRRQNNNPGGGRGLNSDKRVGAIVTPRRNERPAPYNINRQQNQSQQQMNFNQQQQRQKQNVSFEVGIVPINYPNVMLDNLKLDALKEAITNEILKIPQGGPLIRFLGTTSQDGWLKIICADELSYNWLAMLVSRWERAGVRMVEGNSMPQPAILSFYLQGDFRSPDEILNIIEKQNNALNANQWRIINRESDGNGQRITVCVDEQCFQALRSRDFMVFLGLGVVELKPRRSASDDDPFNNNSSSQNFRDNDNSNFLNSVGNNMQGGLGGVGNNNYQSINSGRGNGGSGNNYQNQGMSQGYQRGGNQWQRAW